MRAAFRAPAVNVCTHASFWLMGNVPYSISSWIGIAGIHLAELYRQWVAGIIVVQGEQITETIIYRNYNLVMKFNLIVTVSASEDAGWPHVPFGRSLRALIFYLSSCWWVWTDFPIIYLRHYVNLSYLFNCWIGHMAIWYSKSCVAMSYIREYISIRDRIFLIYINWMISILRI